MTPTFHRLSLAALSLTVSIVIAGPALAATACGSGNFDAWLADFKTDAAAKGIAPQAITPCSRATVRRRFSVKPLKSSLAA